MSERVPKPAIGSILVVDDTPANLQLLGGLLRQLGYSVRMATSGSVAIQAARLLPPDLILLDVRMPGMDGYEVCARLKDDAALKAIPVIFISALDQQEDKVRAFRAGGVDYVAKPFNVEEVEARVRTHVQNHRMQREILGQNSRLERTVAERTRELAESNTRLSQLDRARSEFLGAIAHEIRTPLGVLLGLTELSLSDPAAVPDLDAQRQMFEESRQRLTRLIEDAQLLSSMDVNDPLTSAKPTPLAALVAEVVAETRSRAALRQAGIEAGPVPDVEVSGDRFFLGKALSYLLWTAVTFVQPGGVVRLEAQTTPQEVVLVAETTSYTLPPAAIPAFFEVVAVRKPYSPDANLGLAPAAAAHILKLLGGRVEIANREPAGIRLRVFLPRPPEGEMTAA